MSIRLVVLKPFGGFKRGDMIINPAEVAKILASSHSSFVVRVSSAEG
ncbi:MAG TPA: hypothetical protein PLC74_00310 [Acetobacteraceae bacterium]|nr:hypothetical protein [Acetobacteraceae bacterium]